MATVKYTSVPTKRLSASITAAATSFSVDNIEGWDGVNLTSSDLGSLAYVVFRNDTNTLMEIMEIDPTTIASASITINKRGLKFDGDLTTEVTANKLTWIKNETLVEFGTDVPQLLNHIVRTVGDQTIAGVKTFSSLPATTAGAPVAGNDLANKTYVDTVSMGALTTINVVVPATAGETIANGNIVYFDDTENEWMLTDADSAAKSENVLLGVAQGAGTNGAAITGGVLLSGVDDAQSGMTAGAPMFLSNTAGGISASAGTKEVSIGWAKSATELYFAPRYNQQITEDEQDALAGSEGTPSDSNRYTTETAVQKGVHVYAADAQASDTYVITLDPVPAAYTTGMVIHFKANTANTGAATLNVNSLGAKNILKHNDQTLADGDIEAGQITSVVYDGTSFQMLSQLGNAPAAPKFGGTGADGALSASSGTTTLDFAGAKVLVKNYTSISLTGTAVLTTSNPHAEGSTLILRTTGNVTITSTATPAVDLRSMGGSGGAAGSRANADIGTFTSGGNGVGIGGGTGGCGYSLTAVSADTGVAGAGGGGGGSIVRGDNGVAGGITVSKGTSVIGRGGASVPALSASVLFAHPGGGGGGGAGSLDDSANGGVGGAGGRGGGGLVIECRGALNITSTFNSAGAAGSAAAAANEFGGGGGGGGGGGQILILYGTLTANTATFTVTAGAAGSGDAGTLGSGGNGGAGSAGDSLVAANTFFS